jgi:DNA-binding transcriptional ArsR family regulator
VQVVEHDGRAQVPAGADGDDARVARRRERVVQPDAAPVTIARLPVRSMPSTTSAAVVLWPNGVVIRVAPIHGADQLLTYSYNGIYARGVARAATTADTFNAVAEPRRREILDLLATGEHAVNDLVEALALAQPQVSKHLRVLREVGAVDVVQDGRRRVYRLNGHALKPIHDWVQRYEQTWSERFEALDDVLDELKRKETRGDASD